MPTATMTREEFEAARRGSTLVEVRTPDGQVLGHLSADEMAVAELEMLREIKENGLPVSSGDGPELSEVIDELRQELEG